MNLAAREYILSRLRSRSVLLRGKGVTTKAIYAGSYAFAPVAIDDELKLMREEGILGCFDGRWFLRTAAKKETAR